MKKFIFLILVLSLIGCVSTGYVSQSDLETSNGGKSGIVVLDNGDFLYFKSSFVIVTKKEVFIINEDIKHEFQWRKIRTIHIYNTTKQDEYITQLKQLEKISKMK